MNIFKRSVAIIFILLFALRVNAQQDYFVYLQTENGQPFYVKLNNKVISSSSAGYLILPKLADSNYTFSVGFPKNEFPEQNFTISINNKDEGYLLKNFNEKGWGLFNLQSFDVVMSGATNKTEPVAKNLQSDPFSKMLASVVKDSSILQKNEPVAIVADSVKSKSSNKTDSSNKIVVADKNISSDTGTLIAQNKPSLIVAANKILSKKNKDGMEMVYVDPNANGNDTIRIFIPAKKENTISDTTSTDANITNENVPSSSVKDSSIVAVEKPTPQSNADTETKTPVFINDISSIKNKDSVTQKAHDETESAIVKQDSVNNKNIADNNIDTVKNNITTTENKPDNSSKDQMVVLPKVVTSSKINSDCKAFADNEDFLRLRKKMASENSDDNMIKVAKKAFHTKCFSTEQLKNLSYLFLTNEGKYRFFDEAYAYASDSDQYYTLQSQLTDSYYINRFKAMIHQ